MKVERAFEGVFAGAFCKEGAGGLNERNVKLKQVFVESDGENDNGRRNTREATQVKECMEFWGLRSWVSGLLNP